jgi:hypothetical protein
LFSFHFFEILVFVSEGYAKGFKRGDTVRIKSVSAQEARILQNRSQINWLPGMERQLGGIGIVTTIFPDGDYRIMHTNGDSYAWNKILVERNVPKSPSAPVSAPSAARTSASAPAPAPAPPAAPGPSAKSVKSKSHNHQLTVTAQQSSRCGVCGEEVLCIFECKECKWPICRQCFSTDGKSSVSVCIPNAWLDFLDFVFYRRLSANTELGRKEPK